MSHSVFILYISFLLWAGYCLGIGLFFFSLTLVSFYFWFVDQLVLLPHSYIASAMVSLNLCLLGLLWACHVLFFLLVYITQYFCLVSFHIILGFLGPFYSFGHPCPASFLWASLAYLILAFPCAFAKSFGLLRLNYHILYFWGLLAFALIPFFNSFLWAPPAYLYLLSTYYNSHGLTTSFLEAPLGPFAFFGALLLFCGIVYHCSYHTSLMVFRTLLILLSSHLVILLGFFLSLALFFFAKMGLNKDLDIFRLC